MPLLTTKYRMTTATEIEPGLVLQGITAPLRLKDFKLIAFDMDSTLINIECVDEIADAAGRKAEVAAITEAAMRGEIADYKDSLRQRVALLKGVTVAHMEEVYTRRLQLNPGAAELVAACKAAGLKVLLVSGGFTFFTDRIRDRLGIDFARSNVLEVESGLSCGVLTGKMVDQPWGDICDGQEKRRTLLEVVTLLGIEPAQTIAMGDGANDLPMMGVAGLSIGFHGKPAGFLNVAGYYDGLASFLDHTVDAAFVKPVHRNMLTFSDDPRALLETMAAYRAPVSEKWLQRFEL